MTPEGQIRLPLPLRSKRSSTFGVESAQQLVENLLSKGMTDAVSVGILDLLAHPVWAWMDWLLLLSVCRKRVALQGRSYGRRTRTAHRARDRKQSARQSRSSKRPSDCRAGDANACSMTSWSKLFEELFACVTPCLGDLGFKFLLELVELKLDLLRSYGTCW